MAVTVTIDSPAPNAAVAQPFLVSGHAYQNGVPVPATVQLFNDVTLELLGATVAAADGAWSMLVTGQVAQLRAATATPSTVSTATGRRGATVTALGVGKARRSGTTQGAKTATAQRSGGVILGALGTARRDATAQAVAKATARRSAGTLANAAAVAKVTRSDNFNRANAGALGANWTVPTGANSPKIVSNQAQGAASGISAAYWSADTFGAAQFAAIASPSAAYACGPTARQQPGSDSCYVAWLEYDAGVDDGTFIAKAGRVSAGSITAILTDAPGQSIGPLQIEASGSTIRVKVGGVTVMTGTDATYATGQPGMRLTASVAADDWSGGDL